ncbi:MAG: hypothetical protein GXX86_00415 [Propionibacterium sp.]|nr:hypothetical protein [Propionibacterium sp.]
MFSRVESDSELGTAQPYLLLGACDLASAEGEKPIAITWQLRRPMPQQHFQDANVQSR